MAAFLELRNVTKAYGRSSGRQSVLGGIDLSIDEGEFVAILGFSGSGKTTLISTIAGLVKPDAGEVRLRGKPVTGPSPDRGVVFQSYSLMPWLSVDANVALGVDAAFPREGRAARQERTDRYVRMVGLEHARRRRPAELSGGMRQRVALARALAMQPEILLLDEPLSALDALTRARLQDEIGAICRNEQRTVVLITNDVDEAILMADRIIPLRPAPNATLAGAFRMPFARPRDRAALNDDGAFKRLRAEITRQLADLAPQNHEASAGTEFPAVMSFAEAKRRPPRPRRPRGPASADRFVEFFEVAKDFATPTGPLTVVDGFALTMRQGEFVALIGHSGCGKSTVLSMTAGLEPVSRGGIVVDGSEVADAGPDRAVVFQSPSLFPWLTARQNVALGVNRVYLRATPSERAAIVDCHLALVGLADAADRRAATLSNGMKQRVGIARAFALSPKLLLLDEPFGMLDSLTRWELQDVLMNVWKRSNITAICVTHDIDEAILLADRVVMMTSGPRARIGGILEIRLPRPRSRITLHQYPEFYRYRAELLAFLSGDGENAAGRLPRTTGPHAGHQAELRQSGLTRV